MKNKKFVAITAALSGSAIFMIWWFIFLYIYDGWEKATFKINFFVCMYSFFFPTIRVTQYLKDKPIRVGFGVGTFDVSETASENKRLIAVYFDSLFHSIGIIITLFIYYVTRNS